jgi:hypothetical protein
MIRNAVIALNQANLTGNYSVLRDMGTPNFQISNSSARLAEAFTSLRVRRIDISPIMFFNPKLATTPAVQDGRLLRVTGVFPTTPEQVNFDLAFQLFGEQWLLAAIAVSVTPPSENAQAFAAPAPQPGRSPESAESKPIRIDLSQPAPQPAPGKPAPKKPAAAKKAKPPAAAQTAAAQQPAPVAEQPPAPAGTPAEPTSQPASEKPASGQLPDLPANWNPFGR